MQQYVYLTKLDPNLNPMLHVFSVILRWSVCFRSIHFVNIAFIFNVVRHYDETGLL